MTLSPPDAPPAPRRLAPWWATGLLAALLVIGACVLHFGQHAGRRISTDVLELLPRDEFDATIKLARQTVSGRFGRTLLLSLSDPAHPDKAPAGAAAVLGMELAKSPAFSAAFTGLTPDSKDRLQTWFFERRLPLRLPVWLDTMQARWLKAKGPDAPAEPDPQWLAAQADLDLQEFQTSAAADVYQERLPSDPLLLVPGLLTAFGDDDKTTASDVAGGALSTTGPDGVKYALIQAEIRASPLTEAGQKPVFEAIAHALKTARAKFGAGLILHYTGVDKFAAETRERLEHELGWLTNLSLLLSCALLFIAFRRWTIFVYLLLPIVTATVWSLVICFALFDRVHMMTIIFTTVLVGVALDYGIYTFSHARQMAGGLGRAVWEIRYPLIAGCLTSVGGFIFMTLTTLPMLQQMGVAVALGLVFALALDFLYLPFIPALGGNVRADAEPTRRLELGGSRFPLLALGAVVVAAGLVAAARVRWTDDVRSLDVMSVELRDEQMMLRQLFGQSSKQHIVLTSGKDLHEASLNLEKFNTFLTKAATGPSDHFFNIGKVFPSTAQATRCWQYLQKHPDFKNDLRSALGKDFNVELFAPFWSDWERWQQEISKSGGQGLLFAPQLPKSNPSELPSAEQREIMDGSARDLRSVLPLPLQNLWNDEQTGSAWLATRINDSLFKKLSPGMLAAPNAPLDQVETLNSALRRYRVTALQRGGLGLGFIAVVVLLVYGWRRGAFMLVVPAVSILLTVATLGFLGQSLGLLHVVALLLGFCLASDYSIFLGSPGDLPHSTRRAILLAASTALLSFIVLSFSKVNALRDICFTVTLVIGFVLVLCETSYRLFVRRGPATRIASE